MPIHLRVPVYYNNSGLATYGPRIIFPIATLAKKIFPLEKTVDSECILKYDLGKKKKSEVTMFKALTVFLKSHGVSLRQIFTKLILKSQSRKDEFSLGHW